MNTQLLILSIIEIFLALISSVGIIFVSYKILEWLFFAKQKLQGNNKAFTIFTAGIVISIGLILSEIVPSITNLVRLSVTQNEALDMTTIIGYSLLYLCIGFIVAVVINASVFFLFSILTRGVNEFKEIQKNNTSVAILVVAILVSITLIVKDGVGLLISALVPYPEVSNFL